jgi:hypothetical protein
MVLVAIVGAQTCHAHMDTLLTVTPWGAISGAPSAFGLIRLVVENRESGERQVEFHIGNRINRLLPCALEVIQIHSVEEAQVSGSWYHSEQGLPYYINFRFIHPQPLSPLKIRSWNSFLFNLRTGEVLDVKRVFEREHEGGGEYWEEPIPFPKDCKVFDEQPRPNKPLERTRGR